MPFRFRFRRRRRSFRRRRSRLVLWGQWLFGAAVVVALMWWVGWL